MGKLLIVEITRTRGRKKKIVSFYCHWDKCSCSFTHSIFPLGHCQQLLQTEGKVSCSGALLSDLPMALQLKLAARLGNPFISTPILTSFRAVPETLIPPGPGAPSYIPGSCSTNFFQKEHHQSPFIIQKAFQEKAYLEGSQQLVFIQETDNCMQHGPQKLLDSSGFTKM